MADEKTGKRALRERAMMALATAAGLPSYPQQTVALLEGVLCALLEISEPRVAHGQRKRLAAGQ